MHFTITNTYKNWTSIDRQLRVHTTVSPRPPHPATVDTVCTSDTTQHQTKARHLVENVINSKHPALNGFSKAKQSKVPAVYTSHPQPQNKKTTKTRAVLVGRIVATLILVDEMTWRTRLHKVGSVGRTRARAYTTHTCTHIYINTHIHTCKHAYTTRTPTHTHIA